MAAPRLDDYRSWTERRGARRAARPKISVVTVTFNAVDTIERAVGSLHGQTRGDCEHVVVDGGSTDGTLDKINRLLRPQDFLISEPDAGISDAINKGIALARGDYIQLLHADDWLSPDQIAIAVETLERTGADFVFGDLIFYIDDTPKFRYRGDLNYARVIHRRMPALNHLTALVRRAAYERVGLFDTELRCAMDYDWFLRLHRAGGIGAYNPSILAHMNHDGRSNREFKRTNDEVRRIAIANGRPWLLAHCEARFRTTKTALSRVVRRHAEPLYHVVRRTINRSYDPALPEDLRSNKLNSRGAA